MSLIFINRTHPDYQIAIDIRVRCFFEGHKNAMDLINDEYEVDGIHLVYSNNQKIIGTGRLNIENQTAIISQMAVDPFNQKEGVGTKMLHRLIAKAKELDCKEITLSARVSASAFYQKHGFETEGRIFASHKTKIPHLKMKKAIGNL